MNVHVYTVQGIYSSNKKHSASTKSSHSKLKNVNKKKIISFIPCCDKFENFEGFT